MPNTWSSPGVFEVAPGVHRIPLPLPNDGLRAVNAYAVSSSDGPVLIDPGWDIPEARRVLAEALASLGFGLAEVRRFLVTHIHRDHYTQAIALRREFGTQIGLGAEEESSLEVAMRPGRAPLQQQLAHLRLLGARRLADGLAAHFDAHGHETRETWELPDEWFTEGDVVAAGQRLLDVVPTPGHTRGHVVFHDTAGRLLFSGDHVLPTITPSIGFEPVLSPDPLGDFLGSLAAVRRRPDARLLPAHGPVTESAHRRIDELIAHHGARLDETLAAAARGAETGYDVAGQLRWTRREKRLDELDGFNQMLAVSETGAHLELLVAQGRVTAAVEDGVRRYRVVG